MKVRKIIDKIIGAVRGETAAEEEKPLGRAVLFVCMGNICRSPTAEGVFRSLLEQEAPELEIFVDSAGTHAYHVGHPPDPRACRAAERRGVDLRAQRARQVTVEDFARYELLLAMDRDNHAQLMELCPEDYRERVRLFLEFAPSAERDEVPDPYYGGANGFEHVLDLVEEAARGLLEHLRRTPAPARVDGSEPPAPPGDTAR
jgi:protein-tyrosine phosphatase